MSADENTTGDASNGTGPVYGAAGPGGAVPAPPPPPPGYAAPGAGPTGPTQYPQIIPGQSLDDEPAPVEPSGKELSEKEIREWAAGAHAGGLLAWIPLAPLIPAIAIHAVYKDRSTYLREQSLEAINFQLCILIAYVVATLIDALPLLDHFTLLVAVVSAVFALIAGVAALRGKRFEYPYSHRFVS